MRILPVCIAAGSFGLLLSQRTLKFPRSLLEIFFFSSSGWVLKQQKTVKGHGHFCKITHFFGNGSKPS